eukprot:14006322-Alexandrium_andersonii.AAC.1
MVGRWTSEAVGLPGSLWNGRRVHGKGCVCCEMPERQGIAISRLAEVLTVVFAQLEDEKYKTLSERSVYQRVKA